MKTMTKSLMFALATLIASTTTQAKTWSSAEVILSGSTDNSGVFLRLTDVSSEQQFRNRNFRLAESLESKGLAIGLAAISSKRQVVIYSNIDEVDDGTHPTIQAIYMTKYTAK